jgi:hypothetical protein
MLTCVRSRIVAQHSLPSCSVSTSAYPLSTVHGSSRIACVPSLRLLLMMQAPVTDPVRSISSNTVAATGPAQPVAPAVPPAVQQPSSTTTPPAAAKEAPAPAPVPPVREEPKEQQEQPAPQVKQQEPAATLPLPLPHMKQQDEQKQQQPSDSLPVVRKVPTAAPQPAPGNSMANTR